MAVGFLLQLREFLRLFTQTWEEENTTFCYSLLFGLARRVLHAQDFPRSNEAS